MRLASYPPQEVSHTWYRDADFASFEEDTRITVAAIRQVRGDLRQLNAERFTVTGLEKILSRRQVIDRKRMTVMHVRTVVEQQKRYQDPDKLRRVSELFSKQPLQRAHFRGILDQALLLC